MTDDDTLRLVLIVAFLAILPVGVYHRIKADTPEKLDRRQEGIFILATLRPLGAIFWFGTFAWMVQPLWLAWAAMPLPVWLRYAGIPVLAAGCALLVWTFRSLGKNLTDTVVTRQEHTLVARGPYRWIRHPLYTSVALLVGAISLMTANWLLLMAGAASFCLLALRTRTEEANLVARFGEAYSVYARETGAFVPRFRS